MTEIKGDVLKIQHRKALYQLYKAFDQDIEENDDILVCKRGYEIIDNRDGDKKLYRVVLYIERS